MENLDFEGNEIDLGDDNHQVASRLSLNKSPIIVKTKTIVKNSHQNSSAEQADLSVMDGRKN